MLFSDKLLEHRFPFRAYPHAIQAQNGKMQLIFTSDERTTIWYSVFE